MYILYKNTGYSATQGSPPTYSVTIADFWTMLRKKDFKWRLDLNFHNFGIVCRIFGNPPISIQNNCTYFNMNDNLYEARILYATIFKTVSYWCFFINPTFSHKQSQILILISRPLKRYNGYKLRFRQKTFKSLDNYFLIYWWW